MRTIEEGASSTADRRAAMTHGTRADGARVGAAIGVAALAIGLPSGEGWWLAAAIPAGAIAGAWAGPRVAVEAPIRARLVIGVAATATVVGDAAISAGLALTSETIRGPAGVLSGWVGLIVLGLLSIGWLALLVLLPVSAAALAIVRSRAAHAEPSRSGSKHAAWLAGVVPGVAAGVLSLTLPIVGYEIALLFAVGALLSRRSTAALGGAFLGAGSSWIVLIVNGAIACHPTECLSPDLAPWLGVGVGLVASGCALTAASVTRR